MDCRQEVPLQKEVGLMLSLLNRSWEHSGMLQHTGRLFYLTKRITTSLRLISHDSRLLAAISDCQESYYRRLM